MTLPGSPQELTGQLPDLDVTQYNHWRDYLYNLQVGRTELPGISGDRISDIGHYGFSIGLDLLQGLREGRLDDNGQPFVICVDEIEDEQVISEASQEDRQQFFLSSFLRQAKRRGFHHIQERATSYATASITLGIAVMGMEQAQVINLLNQALDSDSSIHELDKDVLRQSIASASDSDVKTLTQYLQFSQTQMTNEEQRIMLTAQKVAPELGSEPIEIAGETFSFVGSDRPPIELSPQDEAYILPLIGAVKKSRQDMIEQAK